MTRLAVISAGLHAPSSTRLLADRLSQAALSQLAGPVELTTVEVREHAHQIIDTLLSGAAPGSLATALEAVHTADALIVATPTFQGSYSGMFKSFIDLVDTQALRHKPILLAATGGSARHSLVIEYSLRPLFSFLGSTTVPTGVYAAKTDLDNDTLLLEQRIERATSELAVLASLGCGPTPLPQR